MMKTLRLHQGNAVTAIDTAPIGIINLPTGTGKTFIQSTHITQEIKKTTGTKVYVVMSPRILLSNQLLNEVSKDLMVSNTDAQYLAVHSGGADKQTQEDVKLSRELYDLPFRQRLSGTSKAVIIEAYNKAKAENVSLIISSTYHSAQRIVDAGIPVEILYADESHYLVQENFSWIVSTPFVSNRKYFFTATTRETPSEDGMGMNNTSLFGEILYSEVPAALIEAGEMVRPRAHLVTVDQDVDGEEADALVVRKAFIQHNSVTSLGAKLLVIAKDGSDHLDSIATSDELQRLKRTTPGLQIFDITSKLGARIDGVKVTRSVFLSTLQSLKDTDSAIIIHKDILAEGIDIPGITGIMPFGSLKKSKFLQTLGRATRLFGTDRNRLYSGEITSDQLNEFIKPYAWLIIPTYGEIGPDLKQELQDYVRELRSYDFNPAEDIVIVEARGETIPKPIDTVNDPDSIVAGLLEFSANVLHELESQDEADELVKLKNEFARKSLEEKFAAFG